ncbi:hypothetical protein [uncultured Campylobacter sp.]|uniref:hypothetical protein n=1 Tax=uncultured Campylobacter sp. TaxID=218934 RepID=UPI002612E57C|nr:hypothetical protein [uncultured Campylobacter sp.]
MILARKIPLARETGISSARVEFKILKVAFVVRDFICVKNEILSVKGDEILKFKDALSRLNLKFASKARLKI